MDANELRQKSSEELTRLVAELRASLQDVRFAVATNQVKKVRDVRQHKRDLARALTILVERASQTDSRV